MKEEKRRSAIGKSTEREMERNGAMDGQDEQKKRSESVPMV